MLQEGLARFDPGTMILVGLAVLRIPGASHRPPCKGTRGLDLGCPEMSRWLRNISNLGDGLQSGTCRGRSVRAWEEQLRGI